MTDTNEFEEYKKIIEESGLFDSKFYVREYKDARRAKELPLEHFVKFGLKEDRKPNALFDPVWYREYYGDIQEAGVLPFIHYVTYGLKEFRSANENELQEYETLKDSFDVTAYKNSYEDLQKLEDKFDFLWHYVCFGKREERTFFKQKTTTKIQNISKKKNLDFDESKIEKLVKEKEKISFENKRLQNYKNIFKIQKKYLDNKIKALEKTKNVKHINKTILEMHKKLEFASERFLNFFDEEKYLHQNNDVKKVVENRKLGSGLEHLLFFGWEEVNTGKRRLYKNLNFFNEKDYLKLYPDVQNAIHKGTFTSALEHYLAYGIEKKNEKQNIVVHKGEARHNLSKRNVLICAHIVGKTIYGSERSLLDMIEAASENSNVILTTPMMNQEYLNLVKPFVKKIYVFSYGWWKSNNPVNVEAVRKYEKILNEENINIIHVNTIMLREALIAGRNMNIATLTHIRELITGDNGLTDYIGLPVDSIIDEVINRTDYIIGNSRATLNAYKLEENDSNFLLYNTLNTEKYHQKPLDKDNITVGIISSNIPKKGINDFIEVAKLCKNESKLMFCIIGPENELTQNINKLNLKNVKILGYRKTPQEAMNDIDIVLSLSNFTESFGRTVAEGMASSKLVIAYAWGAVPELIEDKKSGYLVDYKDIYSVAKILKKVAKNPKIIKKVGTTAQKDVKQKFDIAVYKKNLEKIYNKIVKKESSKKIKIAYFLWHFPVPSETFVLNELRILVEDGYDVKVYCKQSPFKDFVPDFPIEWERVNDVAHFAELLIRDNRSIVHSHFTYPTVTDMVWPACEIAKKRFTFIAHAQDIFRYENDKRNRISEIAASDYCAKVFVPARFHFNYLLERNVSENKMLINPNGVDTELYKQGLTAKHTKRETRSICAIHRFTEKKGLIYLIEAAKYLDDIIINIHGYGDLEDEYKSLIKTHNLNNVIIHGGVKNRTEMLEIFSNNDLFACPSIRAKDGDMDGIPTVLMEAMSAGIPVLTTAVSGIPDLVLDELTGIVTSSNANSIAADIKRFYTLPDSKVDAIVDNALNHIKQKFNIPDLVHTLLRVWEEKRLDLIVVSWNNLPELKEVCRRLLKYTSLPFRLIVCDNDSKEAVKKYLKKLEASRDEVTVIFNDTNALVGPGTNLALENSDSDYAVYVCGKEGFVFDYGWEKNLVNYMEHNPKVGQAGTLGYSPSYLYGKDYPSGIAEFKNFRNKNFAIENPNRMFKHVQGGFFIMRRKMYNEIGGFSIDVPHNYTDVEYSYYVESCSWELGNIPGMLALFNKTRPGLFSRIDESIHAMHPPMLDEIPKIENIIHNKVKLCNLCEWQGNDFSKNKEGLHCCPQCGSVEADRTLMRHLAETVYTYRRLPALAINITSGITEYWKQQFQGRLLSSAKILDEIKRDGMIANADGKTYVIYLNYPADINPSELNLLLSDFYRLLHSEGELIIQLNENCQDAELLYSVLKEVGLQIKAKKRYTSNTCQYDWYYLVICDKIIKRID